MTREELLTISAEAARRAFPDRVERLLVDLQIRLWWTPVPPPPVIELITTSKVPLKTETHCSFCARGCEKAWRTQPHDGWALHGRMKPFAACAVCIGLARSWSAREKVDPGMARTELLRALRAGSEKEQAAAEELASQRTTVKPTDKVSCSVCQGKPDTVRLLEGLPTPLCSGCLVLGWHLPEGKRFDTTWELHEPDFEALGIRVITTQLLDAFFERTEPLARQRQLEVRRRWGTELVLATEGGATLTFAAPGNRLSVSISAVAADLARPVLERWRVRLKELANDLIRGAGPRER